jgi:hypothetical protein
VCVAQLPQLFDAVLHLEPLDAQEAVKVLEQAVLVSGHVLPSILNMLQGTLVA